MADYFLYPAIKYTGTGEDSLDSYDGSILKDKEAALVLTSSKASFYHLDADSGLAESSPDVISPNTNAGDKRWVLVGLTVKDLTITDGDVYVRNPSDDVARIYIGQAGKHRGELRIEGDNTDSDLGGVILAYLADDYDTTITYYAFYVDQDDLWIGPSTDIDLFKIQGSNSAVRLFSNAGGTANYKFDIQEATMGISHDTSNVSFNLKANVATTTYGIINFRSDRPSVGQWAGAIDWYNGAGAGSTIAKILATHEGTDNKGAIHFYTARGAAISEALEIDNAGDVIIKDGDVIIENSTDGVAIITLGSHDAHYGDLRITGNGTESTQGGLLQVYTAADHDNPINAYLVQAYEDDLYIGPNTNADSLKYNGTGNYWNFTGGDVRIGINHNVYAALRLYGNTTGNPEGGLIYLYCAADYDAVIDSYIMQVYEDDLRIGPITNPDVWKMNADGSINKTAQPCFCALRATTDQSFNAGATTDLVFNSERFDVGSDYNTSNGIFTAPVTGKYLFTWTIRFNAVDTGASYYQLQLVTSNKTYTVWYMEPADELNADSAVMMSGSLLVDMDSSDAAKLTIYQSGGANQTAMDDSDSIFTGTLIN